MIDVLEVSKFYGDKRAVDRVSFRVPRGETLVLLGTSGSGKTTTLRMINRLIEPNEGSILIDYQQIAKLDAVELRRGIGYVLQNYGLFPHYTVAENIAVVPKLLRWPAQKINRRVDELLVKLQLPPDQYCTKYPAELSGGQKQRVGLARALAADPPILLMDEPFGALDTITRMAIRKDFKELDELKRKTIILVTHDVQEAFELGDTIGLMDNGTLEQLGSREQLLFQPANDFAMNFLKHRRLQLELQSIPIQYIWNQLPDAFAEGKNLLNNSATLWDVLDILSREQGPVKVIDSVTQNTKEVRPDDVFSVLANHKSTF